MTETTDNVTIERLPLLALESGVVLPGMVLSMALETEDARAAVEAAVAAGSRVVLVPRLEDRYASVGVAAEVLEQGALGGGAPGVVLRAEARVRIGAAVPGPAGALVVGVEPVGPDGTASPVVVELAREYRAVLEAILEARGARRMAEQLREVADPGEIADLAGYSPDLSAAQKLEVLETVDVEARLRLVLGWGREVLADLTLRERIRGSVEEDLDKTQREFLLRRQLEAIRTELSELSGAPPEPGAGPDYRAALGARQLPAAVRTALERELDRLERGSEQSPEQGFIRSWIDTVLDVPFGVTSPDRLDIAAASAMLDADHEGLAEVKERILEHLSVHKLRAERALPVSARSAGGILALVGPPGVGKTSLGASVAAALGRSFARVSLGGVHDEAEIRGHRRTYVGAEAGRIVRALREAKTMNPVVLLDEVDKLGSDVRGDPAAALLEVLDPAQNHTFRDHYLDLDLDLSAVLFIVTANLAEAIPAALYDRLEVIRLDGYTEAEKVAIARRHLLGRQLESAGLRADELELSNEALGAIVTGYTREAGVRALERELGRLARKAATRLAAGSATVPLRVGAGDLPALLGRPRHVPEVAERTAAPGVATGLAVTGAGGEVLFVEAATTGDGAGLTLTGQLGEVMKESAEIALSHVRAHAVELGLRPDALGDRHVHLHVPAGAVPKDGPSAGITMASALVSLASGRAVRPVVAMTGELSLQGNVLPIGGVVQKVLAARRAGLREVILPSRNGPDLEDLPGEVRDELEFHLVDRLAEVVAIALEPAPAPAAALAAA